MPVDPLVVNFEEESDNESAPSSTPTKNISPDDAHGIARSKSRELLLLEKIQAEAAAFYSYEVLPPADLPKERKIVRTNLSSKYDRLSLDEISGKQQETDKRNSLDFKVLSLEEIRAKKRNETILHSKPITLNLSRKRTLSTHETLTTTGNKIIKVVRSNSIVYKKLDNKPAVSVQSKIEEKQIGSEISRKRTMSEHSDIYEIQEDELVDNCYEFKRIKIAEQTFKPRLIRNRNGENKLSSETKDYELSTRNDDSDSEVQIVSIEINDKHVDLDKLSDTEVIDVETTKLGEPIDIVDLSEDLDEGDITVSDLDLDLIKNVPDVVASCQMNFKSDSVGHNLLKDIDALLHDEL